jgi:hypothetical protein
MKMNIEDKAGVIIAARNYKCTKKKRRVDGVDFSALDTASDEKILLRSMEPQTKAGYVGLDEVKQMLKDMKHQNYDRGVFISKRFTVAASEEMALRKIQQVSDEYLPPVKPDILYLAIGNCINDLCKANCGNIPSNQSECKSWAQSNICRIRTISENASFHFDSGLTNLLNDDLRQLLSLRETPTETLYSTKESAKQSRSPEV